MVKEPTCFKNLKIQHVSNINPICGISKNYPKSFYSLGVYKAGSKKFLTVFLNCFNGNSRKE